MANSQLDLLSSGHALVLANGTCSITTTRRSHTGPILRTCLMEKVVVRSQALRTLDCSRASRRIMRCIFSTEVLLRMNYAGHSVYVENGVKKNKFKLKNSKLFVALVSIMRKIGFKVFRPIKTGILNVVYKSKDLSLNQYEKSKPVSTKQRMADKSEPLIRRLEQVLMRNAEKNIENSKEIENTTEEVLEPMEQVVNNSEQIQTEQEQSANKEKSAEKTVATQKSAKRHKPVENNEIIQITTMEELKELEKSLNTPSFCKEWMGKVLAKIQLHVDFDPVDCRVAARKMMRSIFTTIMLQRMNYAGYTKYDAGDGRIERKFKLKYSKLFAVLVLIMKKLGFKNFSTVKIEILNLVYKSKPQTRKPENSDSECCEDAQKRSKRCASNIGGGGQVGPEKQAESPGKQSSQPDNFPKLSTIKEAKELERQLKHSSYFTKWTDEVASKLELYTSPLCSDVARHMMKLVFDPSMWLKMNFAGRSMYDAGDGFMMDKFKLKHSKLFGALVCVMKKLGFKNFYDNKKAILSIVYKSNPRVPAKLSETQTATPSKSVSEHSSSSALNSKSKPTKQKVVTEHSSSSDLNSKSKPTKQKVVSEHSSSSALNSKPTPAKQKVVSEHSSSSDLNSKSKQKVVTEHSSSPEQEDLNSKCAEEILFGNFELATLTCSTASIPIESSTSNVVTDNIEPGTISSIEQVLTSYFDNSNDEIVANVEDSV